MADATRVDRRAVVAFRLGAQAADPEAGAWQDHPPGAAESALALRGASVGGLVRTWSVRLAAHLVAPEALPAFTRGLLPDNEDEYRALLAGAGDDTLEESGRSRGEAVAETRAGIAAALAERRPLTRDELHEEMLRRLPPELLMWCARCGSRHSPPKVWRAAALDGTYVLGPPRGREAVSCSRSVSAQSPPTRCRPSGCAATCAGTGPRVHRSSGRGPASRRATRGGTGTWSPASWSRSPAAPARARGCSPPTAPRSPPPCRRAASCCSPRGDPLLTGRDRDTLAPDERLRAALFRPAGSSGAVFVDGDLRGTWRARMSGGVLRIETDVARVRPQDAEDLARVRGARRVEVGAPMR